MLTKIKFISYSSFLHLGIQYGIFWLTAARFMVIDLWFSLRSFEFQEYIYFIFVQLGLQITKYFKYLNSIWHDGLLFRLRKSSFPSVFLLIKYYPITGRYFQIRVECCISEIIPIKTGVSQRRILSPLFFNIYAADQPIF